MGTVEDNVDSVWKIEKFRLHEQHDTIWAIGEVSPISLRSHDVQKCLLASSCFNNCYICKKEHMLVFFPLLSNITKDSLLYHVLQLRHLFGFPLVFAHPKLDSKGVTAIYFSMFLSTSLVYITSPR